MLPFISGHDLSLADEALGWEWADNAVETACSFSADTPVATAHGETAISAIHTGDQVLAYNEQTGATGYYTVTATLQHADPAVLHLTIDGESVKTTPEHPFYQITATAWWLPGQWTPAGQLHQGDQVRKADGTTGVVQAVNVEAHAQVMYNLTVATAHTFFVGAHLWLVHNSCNWWLFGDVFHSFDTKKPPLNASEWGAVAHYQPADQLKQIALYDEAGQVIIHIDAPDAAIPFWHWHEFPPGNPASGHGTGAPHYPIDNLEEFLASLGFDVSSILHPPR